jgi:hypothetical protein
LAGSALRIRGVGAWGDGDGRVYAMDGQGTTSLEQYMLRFESKVEQVWRECDVAGVWRNSLPGPRSGDYVKGGLFECRICGWEGRRLAHLLHFSP